VGACGVRNHQPGCLLGMLCGVHRKSKSEGLVVA
jgi:hypothetical protein